jgi:hypothetical protein
MELTQKINQLDSVISSVAKHLNDSDLLEDLKKKQENMKFWRSVDLKAFVRARIKQQEVAKMIDK